MKLVFRSLLFSLLLICTAEDVRAQDPGSFFNAFGELMREAQRAELQRRQQAIAVKRVQAALQRMGYYQGTIDGEYGPGTAEALSAYYRSQNINPPAQITEADIVDIESRARLAQNQADYEPDEPEPEVDYRPVSQHASDIELTAVRPRERIQLKLAPGSSWIVAASREQQNEAIELATAYAQDYSSVIVAKSTNKLFAILVGWALKENAEPIKSALVSQSMLPGDAFLSSGEKFGEPIWAVSGSSLKSRIDVLKASLLRVSPEFLAAALQAGRGDSEFNGFVGQVIGLSSADSYLSLRKTPSAGGEETRRLPENTLLLVLDSRDAWLKVRLLNGMEGWISSRFVRQSPGITAAETSDTKVESGNAAIEETERERITAEAQSLLKDVDLFLKSKPDTPDIAGIAQDITTLQEGLKGKDYAVVEANSRSLRTRMSAMPEFKTFQQDREELRKQAEVKALGDAVTLARRNVHFLTRYIAQNVTAPSTPKLTPYLNKYDSALKYPSLDTLIGLNKSVASTVGSEGLKADFDQLTADFKDVEVAGTSTEQQAAKPEFEKTEATRPVLEGDLGDLIMLYNDSGTAPHVIRNLRGDIVFEDEQALACYIQEEPAKAVAEAIQKEITLAGVATVQNRNGRCPVAQLLSHDLVVAVRGEMLKLSREDILPVLGLVEAGKLRILKVVPAAEFQALVSTAGNAAVTLESEIERGVKAGYGLIRVRNEAARVCMTVKEKLQGHQKALENQEGLLTELLGKTRDFELTDVDAAFVGIKRQQCGAVYGSADDLKLVLSALRRDGIGYQVASLWFIEDDIAKWQNTSAAEENELAQKDAEQRRKLEDEKKLADKRAADQAASRESKERQLQSEFGARARAKADELAAQVQAIIDEKQGWGETSFPVFAKWYQAQKSDGWEFVSKTDEIADYGVSLWKERKLEAAFIASNVNMKNRIVGENKTYCFLVGVVFDEEFSMVREPYEQPCDVADTSMKNWKQEQKFTSQWTVQ